VARTLSWPLWTGRAEAQVKQAVGDLNHPAEPMNRAADEPMNRAADEPMNRAADGPVSDR
jgi:hypothetical protein